MIQDKLTPEERRRLEALNQANVFHASRGGAQSNEAVVRTAETFDKWIKEGISE